MIGPSWYQSCYTGAQIDKAIGAVFSGKAIVVTNCPNCGAPINGKRKCEYCGTTFSSGEEEITLELDTKAVARVMYVNEHL